MRDSADTRLTQAGFLIGTLFYMAPEQFTLISIADTQAISAVRSGSFEVGAFWGASYGIDQFGVMGGGNVTFAANKWILPIHEAPAVPYLVFGVGALKHFDRTVTASYTGVSGVTTPLPLSVPGGSNFALNTGGGIRFYLGQRFGFRVEAKAYKPAGDFPDVFGKVERGFFSQLR